MPASPPVRAAGPLGAIVTCSSGRLDTGFGADANALVLLNRIAFPDARTLKLEEGGKRALLGWACDRSLGQEPGLVKAVSRRRAHALQALSAGPAWCVRLRAEPEWRLVVGHGIKANAYETGLALHGTYGWPVIPGSALKGLAAAWAASPGSGVEEEDIQRVLGSPRPGEPLRPGASAGARARQGTVRFLDAIPDGKPAEVLADVLTPHVKPYYDSLAGGSAAPVPPAEYHNPVPVTFLAVRGGYAVDLYGTDEKDVEVAAAWLTAAGDELGAGAKTAAGYGYLSVFPRPWPPETP